MKIRLVPILTIVALTIASVAWGQGLPTTKPQRVGLSPERLERITNALEGDVEAGRIPGALALVARHGKVAYLEARGMADMEAQKPMDEDTIFRIYSMSKPITSTCLMILHEEGRFLLKDPVSKYLPELGDLPVAILEDTDDGFRGIRMPTVDEEGDVVVPKRDSKEIQTVPADRDMTVLDLLRHTAGLTYGFFGNTNVDRAYRSAGLLFADKSLEDMVAKLGKIPLLYQPGTRWHYSVAVDVQGRLIEVLSGMPFDQFLEERLCGPLGMVDTGFHVPKEDLHRLAQLYSPSGAEPRRSSEGGGLEPANPLMSRGYVQPPRVFSGGGGMVSTAADYLRFCQMHLNGGQLDGVRILSRKTTELMSTNHLGDIPMGRGGYGFGLGFAVAMDQGGIGMLGSAGEYNWGGAAGTKFWIDPKEDLIGIYMIQILPHRYNFGTIFKNLTYQAIAD